MPRRKHGRPPGGRDGRSATRLVLPAVLAVLVLAAVGMLVVVGPLAPAPQTPEDRSAPSGSATPEGPNPFAGTSMYVDPAAAAEPKTSALAKVTRRPHAAWFGDWVPTTTQLTAQVSALVRHSTVAKTLPVLVAYDIPLRDCRSYSGGGASSPSAYRAWIDAFAAAIGSHRAVVVLEPDALAQADCLPAADRATRYALLQHAVHVLGALPAVTTYLDAGHSAWVPPHEMARRLARAGVWETRGFALNVSNFQWTADEVRYGRSLSARLGWKHFIIDTSRNGLGPASGPEAWCNPAGRALGAPPLTPVTDRLVDALLWIKRPGESDGSCGRGEPRAGTFWPDYALGLAQRSPW